MKLLHIGYAARDFDTAIAGFMKMGYTKVHPEPAMQPVKNLKVMKLTQGDVVIEIMSTADAAKESFVTAPLAETSKDLVVFHLAYTVENIEDAVKELTATGDFVLLEPIEIGGGGSCKYCYMQGRIVGLIELLVFLNK